MAIGYPIILVTGFFVGAYALGFDIGLSSLF